MKINRMAFIGLVAGAFAFGAMSVAAVPPPPPPGMHLAPGMAWCPRCGGCGRVPSGFLGLKEKRCPECKGHGMVTLRPVPPPPPPPPPKHVHHPAPHPAPHAAPPPKHAPKPVKHGPGPR